jgi:hypothetical protein
MRPSELLWMVFQMVVRKLVSALRHPLRTLVYITAGYVVVSVTMIVVGAILFMNLDALSLAINDPANGGPVAAVVLGATALLVYGVWRVHRWHRRRR